MLARVATFHTLPDGLDDGAVDLLRETIRASRATSPASTSATRGPARRCR